MQLINKTNSFINRIRWIAYFFHNKDTKPAFNDPASQFKGLFRFRNSSLMNHRLKQFGGDLWIIDRNVKFQRSLQMNIHLRYLYSITKEIHPMDEILVRSDKTGNRYKITRSYYTQLLGKEIHKNYKISHNSVFRKANLEVKSIIEKYNLQKKTELLIPSNFRSF